MLSLTTDKDSATLCDDDCFDIHHALVYGVTPAGFLFLVCIVLIVVICVLVCIITLKKDTHTPKLMYYLVRNAEPDTKTQPEMLANSTAQTADQLQPTVTVMGTPTQKEIPPGSEDGVTAAGNQSGAAPSCDQQTGNEGIEQVDTDIAVPPLSQQQSVISSIMGTPTQRELLPGGEDGVTAAGNQSGAPSHDQQTGNGGIEQAGTGIAVPLLSQQQPVISSNVKFRPAHKGNPVYHLVKQSMKDAKFPERKYRRLKEELRSTCEKCKKVQ